MEKHELPFEGKYSYEHAKSYYIKHQSARRHLTTWLEGLMIKRAARMAGNPKVILDLPCGFGRLWPAMIATGAMKISAADKSAGMLQVAKEMTPSNILSHVMCMLSTATEIELPDKSVDSVFCMRLLHHINDKNYRLAMYHSFQRVARDTVVVSLWSQNSMRYYSNTKHKIREGKNSDTAERKGDRHFFNVQEMEAEFIEGGFEIIGHIDMLPYISPWRAYVLKVK
jgi:SAM-dependent methyltransferase